MLYIYIYIYIYVYDAIGWHFKTLTGNLVSVFAYMFSITSVPAQIVGAHFPLVMNPASVTLYYLW